MVGVGYLQQDEQDRVGRSMIQAQYELVCIETFFPFPSISFLSSRCNKFECVGLVEPHTKKIETRDRNAGSRGRALYKIMQR